MSVSDLPLSVTAISSQLRQIVEKARRRKPSSENEPHNTHTILASDIDQIVKSHFESDPPSEGQSEAPRSYQSAFETAARAVLYGKLAPNQLQEHGFEDVWTLLDAIQSCADQGRCDSGLPLWLVEELLDTQTIEGCREVFDYLESRRDRLAGENGPLINKRNTMLRTCNELLRRLSRAEDAVFCGRVFTFLFQMFPLGDKSAINLRGEYHTENETTFDLPALGSGGSQPQKPDDSAMDIDREVKSEPDINGEVKAEPMVADTAKVVKTDEQAEAATTVSSAKHDSTSKSAHKSTAVTPSEGHPTSVNALDSPAVEDVVSSQDFYPIFWSLQNTFSNPTKIFDARELATFEEGIELTVKKFREVPTVPRVNSTAVLGTKRKRSTDEQDFASAFNPKYLTSRELFELELGDLTFQRHILVQTLIIIDFMLSFTPKAKRKYGPLKPQKAMEYGYTLNDKDTQWATRMKSTIMSYLAVPTDGKFYTRMVENVLSRDKNWLRWKLEACPPIEKPALATEDYTRARDQVKKACTNRRLRPTPIGALRLDFLSELETTDKLALLRDRQKEGTPALKGLLEEVKAVDFDLGFADKTKEPAEWLALVDKRASKSWRALRLASKDGLDRFADVDETTSLEALVAERSTPLEDREPVIEVKPDGVQAEEAAAVEAETEEVKTENVTELAAEADQMEVAGGDTGLKRAAQAEPLPKPIEEGIGITAQPLAGNQEEAGRQPVQGKVTGG